MTVRIIYIPADNNKPMEEVTLESIKYPALNDYLQMRMGSQQSILIERVQTRALHALADPTLQKRWPSVNMIVDEEGRLKELPWNDRAGLLYNANVGINGDVLLIGENVEEVEEDGEMWEEPTWVGLPMDVTVHRVADLLAVLEAMAK